jgi:predicted ATP-dependent endonuclease of OLD family
MHISRIYIKNYRNFEEFDLYIPDGNPLTLIGGNNSGKTNLLQAFRLVLDSSMPSWSKRLSEEDFCWSKEEDCWKKGEEIVVTVTFSNVDNKEEIQSLLYSIAPKSNDENPLENSGDNLEANISFVFAPSTINKETDYDLVDDYVSFLVAGRYHPSGYYYLPDGSIEEYGDAILSGLHACQNKADFYKYFYLAEEDIEKIRENPSASFEKQLYKQPFANKVRKHINLLALDALRDVKNDFYFGYNSLVSQLIRGGIKNTSNNKISQEVSDALKNLRSSGAIPEANTLLEEIEARLQSKDINLLSDKADLVIGTPNVTLENIGRYFNFLVNLKEDLKPAQDMSIVGLGYQNLAYISAIFALFELKKELILNDSDEKVKIIYNLLLIEEPESHLDVQNQKYLHTQIENKTQKLMELNSPPTDNPDGEEKEFFAFTQVIQTSHSTHLASKSDLKNLVVLQKGVHQAKAVNIDSVLQLNGETYGHNRRILRQYLDATRSSLLFARKVVLVEGLSEKYALGTIVNSYLKKQKPDSTIDIDSEGIEIVEVGGKIFDPFNALFSNDVAKGLNNKCLNIRDGDSHLDADKVDDYEEKYNSLNPAPDDTAQGSLLKIKKNIYTFEVDCFFLPDPANPSTNNIEYLKKILFRFMQDGDYFKMDATFASKITTINNFATLVQSNDIDKAKFERLFSDLIGHEVSKPSLSLYLSSLLKAKLLQDPVEIKAWEDDSEPNAENGVIPFNELPEFVIPKYIEDGITWLITE